MSALQRNERLKQVESCDTFLSVNNRPSPAVRGDRENFPGAAVRTSTPKSSGRFCARPSSGTRALPSSRTYDFRSAADSARSANGRRRRRAGTPSTPSVSRPTTSTRWVAALAARGYEFKNPVCDHDKFRCVMCAAPGDLLIELVEWRELARWGLPSRWRAAAWPPMRISRPYFLMQCIIDKENLTC